MTGGEDEAGPVRREEVTRAFRQGDDDALESIVDRLVRGDGDDRNRCLRALRSEAIEDPGKLRRVVPDLERLLLDEQRSVRLATTKLFVAVAEASPDTVLPVVSAIAGRLADEDEFYYVRARSAEALGYVALEHPEAVASPAVLADLHVGLSFDEPEVKQKLAKALEYVALGDPSRLRHRVTDLAEHLDDEDELVRYHLCTALVVVGCEFPGQLADAVDELEARLDDDVAQITGRAAEALGLLERAEATDPSTEKSRLVALLDAEEPFVAERAHFAVGAVRETTTGDEADDGIGTVEGVRASTVEAIEDITSPDGDGECPHCGLPLPEIGPPTCPRCGGPY